MNAKNLPSKKNLTLLDCMIKENAGEIINLCTINSGRKKILKNALPLEVYQLIKSISLPLHLMLQLRKSE
jgi:hypothetical protein